MRRRLAFVVGVFAVHVGCFQVESHVTLAADGSGTYRSTVHMAESVVAMLQATPDPADGGSVLPEPPTRKALRSWGREGLRDVVVRVSDRASDYGFSVNAAFERPSALALLRLNDAPGPQVVVRDVGGGEYSLAIERLATQPPPTFPTPTVPSPTGEQEASTESIEAATRMLAEAASFRVAVTVEVPGEVVAFTPSWGEVDGRAVTWALDMTTAIALGAQMQEQGARLEGFEVRFRMPGPAALPPSALTP